MADFVKRSRSVLSEILYVGLNLFLAAAVTALIYVTNSWILSLVLVFLSKWRVFAVRPRFWPVNIKSNMVDFIVGVSFVFIIYLAGEGTYLPRLALTVLYALWLLVIKPRSSTIMTEIQAGTSIFLGTMAATLILFELPSIFLVVTCFIIGYAAARHILLASDETHTGFMAIIFGALLAQLSWISYHWLTSYHIPTTTLAIPQLSIIASFISFGILVSYKSYLANDGKIRLADIFIPVAFSLAIILVIIIGFSDPAINIS